VRTLNRGKWALAVGRERGRVGEDDQDGGEQEANSVVSERLRDLLCLGGGARGDEDDRMLIPSRAFGGGIRMVGTKGEREKERERQREKKRKKEYLQPTSHQKKSKRKGQD
jgi:hypothetical protein